MQGMSPPLPAFVEALPGGVYTVDTGFHGERYDAAYLLVQDGRAAFIDTGTNLALPRLLAALDAAGVAHDAVDWIIPTHVHLDHAGGAGLLAQALPQARVAIHPRGAPHLIDPERLWNGALAIYGAEEMERWYGRPVPVPAERVLTTHDGLAIELAGRRLEFADTPGHARHHHCIWDEATRGWFTGDTFGVSYQRFDSAQGAWAAPATTPVQFEPGPLRASMQRLMARDPRCVYLTHYGCVTDVAGASARVLALLERMVALGEAVRTAPDRDRRLRDGLTDLFTESLAAHGSGLDRAAVAEALAVDIELDAQGMVCWLDRPA